MLVRERDSAKRNSAARIPAPRAGQIPEGVPFGAATPLSVSEATAATRIAQDSTAAETASVIASGTAAEREGDSGRHSLDDRPGRRHDLLDAVLRLELRRERVVAGQLLCDLRARDGARRLRS